MQKRMSAFDIRAKEDNNKGYAPGYFFPTHFYAPGFFFYHLGGGAIFIYSCSLTLKTIHFKIN
jgi:hypothetical protein